MSRAILYSVLCDGYDRIRPITAEPGLDLLLFTDQPAERVPPPWRRAPMPPRGDLNPRRWSRLVKLCPHRYLPPHNVSIYADANLHFRKPVLAWALDQLKDADVAVHRHPARGCAYAEAQRCIDLQFDDPQTIAKHVARLRKAGFPENLGLGENCLLIRRDTPATRALGELWLAEYRRGSQRDQLSFMFAAWKLSIPLWFIEQNSRRNHYYGQKRHLKDRRVLV